MEGQYELLYFCDSYLAVKEAVKTCIKKVYKNTVKAHNKGEFFIKVKILLSFVIVVLLALFITENLPQPISYNILFSLRQCQPLLYHYLNTLGK